MILNNFYNVNVVFMLIIFCNIFDEEGKIDIVTIYFIAFGRISDFLRKVGNTSVRIHKYEQEEGLEKLYIFWSIIWNLVPFNCTIIFQTNN